MVLWQGHVQPVGKRDPAVGNGQLLRRGRFRRERETRREEKSGRRERSPKLRNRHFTPLRTNSSVPHGILVWRLRVKRKPGRSADAPPRHPNRSKELLVRGVRGHLREQGSVGRRVDV